MIFGIHFFTILIHDLGTQHLDCQKWRLTADVKKDQKRRDMDWHWALISES